MWSRESASECAGLQLAVMVNQLEHHGLAWASAAAAEHGSPVVSSGAQTALAGAMLHSLVSSYCAPGLRALQRHPPRRGSAGSPSHGEETKAQRRQVTSRGHTAQRKWQGWS